MPFDEALYKKLLGDELRASRKRRSWTRKTVLGHLQANISLQTLATYELGIRQVSVVRFADICHAMDERPHDLLARVYERMASDRPGYVWIDIGAISSSTDPKLQPVRTWAQARFEAEPNTQLFQIESATLDAMALLCGVSSKALVNQLCGGAAQIFTMLVVYVDGTTHVFTALGGDDKMHAAMKTIIGRETLDVDIAGGFEIWMAQRDPESKAPLNWAASTVAKHLGATGRTRDCAGTAVFTGTEALTGKSRTLRPAALQDLINRVEFVRDTEPEKMHERGRKEST